MIKAKFFKNESNELCGFEVKNHGDPIVCSAVSVLTLNTVNGIETFTDCSTVCEYEENGGYIKLMAEDAGDDTKLLLKALELGLVSLQNEYPKHIRIVS